MREQVYRKKPVIIKAMQFTPESKNEVFNWIISSQPAAVKPVAFTRDRTKLKIATLEGNMTAIYSDWIIKGVKGEFYPCKDDIFKATYEFVEDKNRRKL